MVSGLSLALCMAKADAAAFGRQVYIARQRCAIVDYKKLDAALAAALSGNPDCDEKSLEVFVHMAQPLDESEKGILQQLGPRIDGQGTILTARLSAHDIDALSCRTSIRYMSLSQRLRPAK